MMRMGKSIPEHKPPPPAPMVAPVSKQAAANAGSAGTSAMKKVYCTPKINFVGE